MMITKGCISDVTYLRNSCVYKRFHIIAIEKDFSYNYSRLVIFSIKLHLIYKGRYHEQENRAHLHQQFSSILVLSSLARHVAQGK